MQERRKDNKAVVGLIAVCVLVLGVCGLVVMAIGQATGHSPTSSYPRSYNLSNIKQMALALAMYSTDYDDRLPTSMGDSSGMESVLYPYVKNNSIFRSQCPGGGPFQSNASIAGALTTEVKDPEIGIMLYDPKEWPNGMRAVAYLDYHAKYITPFDPTKDLTVGLTPAGEKDLQKVKDMIKNAEDHVYDASKPTGPLGMPGQ